MLLDISFQVRRAHLANLQAAQTLATELEDDLIAARKWKREIQTGETTSNVASAANNTDAMLLKLSNEMISLKKQIAKLGPSFKKPCQDILRKPHEERPLTMSCLPLWLKL